MTIYRSHDCLQQRWRNPDHSARPLSFWCLHLSGCVLKWFQNHLSPVTNNSSMHGQEKQKQHCFKWQQRPPQPPIQGPAFHDGMLISNQKVELAKKWKPPMWHQHCLRSHSLFWSIAHTWGSEVIKEKSGQFWEPQLSQSSKALIVMCFLLLFVLRGSFHLFFFFFVSCSEKNEWWFSLK